MEYFVYVLQSLKTARWYIGYTSDLERRITEHNSGRSNWTKNKGPWKLIYNESFSDARTAKAREVYLKSGWGRKWLKRQLAGTSF
jgi:putative endonuclease